MTNICTVLIFCITFSIILVNAVKIWENYNSKILSRIQAALLKY
jgi:hypothetical protein